MSSIDWGKLADEAASLTDDQLKNKISSLSRLNDNDIEQLINETGISKVDMINVLNAVNNASESNESKANSIKSISKGVDFLVGIIGKLL